MNSQTQLETGENIKYGDHANLGNKVTAKITNVYEQYQQVKLRNRDDQRLSVGMLWTEEDLYCRCGAHQCGSKTLNLLPFYEFSLVTDIKF